MPSAVAWRSPMRPIRRRGDGPDGGHLAEMLERFRDRPPFDAWDPAVLRDYVTYGLLPAPDGRRLGARVRPRSSRPTSTWAALENAGVHDSVARVQAPGTGAACAGAVHS